MFVCTRVRGIRGVRRTRACAGVLGGALAFAFGLQRAASLGAQPASDPLAVARTTLAAARSALLANLAAATVNNGDAYDIVYRLNAASAALDRARAGADPGYVAERELAARLDAAWAAAATSGTCPPPAPAGASETCFRTSSDGTLQPLALYVPAGIEERPPAVVVLRGRGETESDFLARREVRALADSEHAVLIAPYARGRALYDRSATLDVFDALDFVERLRPLDTHRIYVAGYSMGGIAAFHIAGTAPQRFAAVLSIAGALDGSDRSAMRGFAGRPAYVVNGENDDVIPPAHGKDAVRYLGSAGVPARYYEQPHGDHRLHSLVPALATAWHDMFAGAAAGRGAGGSEPLPVTTHAPRAQPN